MSRAEDILSGLGGAANVAELEPCITRLRVVVRDPEAVDEPAVRAAGAVGVIRSGRIIQVVVGTEVDVIAAEIDNLR